MERWFESAQTDACALAVQSAETGNSSGDDDDGNEGDARLDGTLGLQAMELDGTANDGHFVIDPSLKDYMTTFLPLLKAQAAANIVAGEHEKNKRREALPRASQSLGGRALPTDKKHKKSARRATMDGPHK
jgi:hypothetical protein